MRVSSILKSWRIRSIFELMSLSISGSTQGYSAGLAGIAQGVSQLHQASRNLSREPNVEAIVSSKIAKHQVEASTKVIQAYDEMLGHMIDTLG